MLSFYNYTLLQIGGSVSEVFEKNENIGMEENIMVVEENIMDMDPGGGGFDLKKIQRRKLWTTPPPTPLTLTPQSRQSRHQVYVNPIFKKPQFYAQSFCQSPVPTPHRSW